MNDRKRLICQVLNIWKIEKLFVVQNEIWILRLGFCCINKSYFFTYILISININSIKVTYLTVKYGFMITQGYSHYSSWISTSRVLDYYNILFLKWIANSSEMFISKLFSQYKVRHTKHIKIIYIYNLFLMEHRVFHQK